MVGRQAIYEWMTDVALDFFVTDKPAGWDDEDWDGPFLDTDALTDAAHEKFGDAVPDEHYRDHGYDPSRIDDRLDFFAELAQLVDEPV